MSSSDDEWRNPPAFPGSRLGGGVGGDALMAARRRGLQGRSDPVGQGGSARPRQDAGPATKSSAGLPWDELPPQGQTAPKQQTQSTQQDTVTKPHPEATAGVTEEALETLRRELEAKKKVLAAAKEKEEALRERWSAQKAQRLAQIAQLDTKLAQAQNEMDEIKAAAERELHEVEVEQQKKLAEERERMEKALREEYEPQIEAQRALLKDLQEKEAKLQSELNASDAAKDVINKCVSSALLTILDRVEGMFNEDSEVMREWECEVERLVSHEVRSSFAVASDSEAQREREEYQKLLQETLAFWRKAEEEEREYVLKMDEQLLLDLQSLVHDDLDRLQREEMSMEEMYVESREAWVAQHQQSLQRELDAALCRRASEFEEQRTMRHEIHLERMKAAEEKQKDMVEIQRWFHEKQMAILREQHAKEEKVAELRDRVLSATRSDVMKATEEFADIVHVVEDLLGKIKDYRATVDDGRVALEEDCRRALEGREATLTALQDIVSKQTVTTTEEYNSLVSTVNKLESVRSLVEQHIESERVWLGKQEAVFKRNKTEWEREYRRWRQMVEDEKIQVQDRFNYALNELREAALLLAQEERDSQAEHTAMSSWLQTVSEEAVSEMRQLEQREEDLKGRHDAMVRLTEEMQQKGATIVEEWKKLQHEREELLKEKSVLHEDELRLEQTAQYLQSLKAQLEALRAETTSAKTHADVLQNELLTSSAAMNHMQSRGGMLRTGRVHLGPSRQHPAMDTRGENRLPQRVLQELRELVVGEKTQVRQTAAGVAVAAAVPSEQENESPCAAKGQVTLNPPTTQVSQRQRANHTDPQSASEGSPSNFLDSSNNNFTSLIAFTDSDTPQRSHHSS
ncbi:hypothetical protein ERJ75_001728400 [Trypanosoma vivax]|nr:hypothetical protein TRVL_00917 [Trypanosoma vivax]KAH8604313.1 hypothetical protein ERJ75_001728400 [Trypanosoma vivax]